MANKSGLKLFVGQVPPTCSEDELLSIFNTYGDVKEVMLLEDRDTGIPKGSAFVTFATEKEAQTAIEALNGQIRLDGADQELIVRVAYSRKSEADWKECKIYVAMLSRNTDENELNEMFAPFGDIVEVYIMREKNGTSKGSAFVKFRTQAEAQRAISAMHESIRDKDAPKPLQVRLAFTPKEKSQRLKKNIPRNNLNNTRSQSFFPQDRLYQSNSLISTPYLLPGNINALRERMYTRPPPNPFLPTFDQPYARSGYGLGVSPYAMQQFQLQTQKTFPRKKKEVRGPTGANIFVFGIPDAYSDEDLGSLFSNFGKVLSSNIQFSKDGRSKGYGFVSFDQKKSAESAIHAMHGFVIGNKRLEVRLKKRDVGHKPY